MKFTESQKDHFIRYRTEEKKSMTLIIGAVCDEGIVLVGDTKIVDTSKNTHTFEDKILTPLEFPVAVGAAGLSNLAQQFKRRIPIIVDRRQKEFRIKNESELMKIGRSITEYEKYQEEHQQKQSNQELKKESKPESTSEPPFTPPYVYTLDDFLTDCKNLVRNLADEGRRYSFNPIEMLMSFSAGDVVLFHIDSEGFERQITTYHAIGSGSVFVDLFFRNMWKNKSLLETIALSSFIIKFVQDMQLDNFVGIDKGELPQVVVILNNGIWGDLDFKNKPQFLEAVNKNMEKFSNMLKDMNLDKLQLEDEYNIE